MKLLPAKKARVKNETDRPKKAEGTDPERTRVNSLRTKALVGGVYTLIGLGALGGITGGLSAMNESEAAPPVQEYVATTSAEGAALTYMTSWLQATQRDQKLMEQTSGTKLPVAPQNRVQFTNVAVADAERVTDDTVAVTVSTLVAVPSSKEEDQGEKDAGKTSEKKDSAKEAQKTAEEAKEIAEQAKAAASGEAVEGVEYQTRYYQLSVRQQDGQVQVIGFPTPAPAPERPSQEMTLDYSEKVGMQTELAQTIDGFLQSYAAGEGDTNRYLSPESTVRGIDPAPYSRLHVLEMRANQKHDEIPEGQELRLMVQAEAELPSSEGDKQAVTFALTVQEREDRWEVKSIDPAPLISDETDQ